MGDANSERDAVKTDESNESNEATYEEIIENIDDNSRSQLPDDRTEFVSTFTPREDLVVLLSSLDFSREAAVKALFNTGNCDADRAASWLLENCDDPHLNDPLNLDESYETDEDDDFVRPEDMYKMVFVVNSQLNMGVGKIAAQVAHAALGLHRILLSRSQESLYMWEKLGETKIAVRGENSEQLTELSSHASSLRLPNYIVHDAGHTQVEAGSRTVLGVFGQVDKVNTVTGRLKLL